MSRKHPLSNQQGFGLLTAIFVITILATFGVLIARYTMTSAVSSAEDYAWAQALYSADSVAQLRILCHDQGGGFAGACGMVAPGVAGFTATINDDTFFGAGLPATLRVKANRGPISREVEVKYIL